MFESIKNMVLPSKLRAAGVLGMNARNYDIIAKNNKRRLYPLVDDKVQTKKLANEVGINTPRLIGVIEVQKEVDSFLNLVKDYKDKLQGWQLEMYNHLKDYFDTNILSNLMAPFFPEQSRNCMWILSK